jgi:hypothetical protein
VRRGNELSERSRFRHHRRQLRPGHRQQTHVFGAKRPCVNGLDDEDTLEQASFDDRDTEERPVRIFARFGKILEARVRRCVGDELWSEAFGDKPREPLREPHPDPADAFGTQPHRCGQDQVGAIGLEQVDRTDVGAEPALDEMNDVVQGFRGVAARRHQPADFLERPQRRILVTHRHVSDAHRPSAPDWSRRLKLSKDSKNSAPRAPARAAVFPALRGPTDAVEPGVRRLCRITACGRTKMTGARLVLSPRGSDSLKTPRNCRTSRADHVLLSHALNRICPNIMLPVNLDTREFHQLVDRVRSEFLEMPGLRLTLPQAARLWGLDSRSCEAVVDALIRSAFLQRTSTGAVTRVDG